MILLLGSLNLARKEYQKVEALLDMSKTLQLFGYLHRKCYRGQPPVMQRLEKIAYLCDWYSSLYNQQTITDINWVVKITGIEADAKNVGIETQVNLLSSKDTKTADLVIEKFNLKKADIGRLKPLVNSTYPAFLQQPIGMKLDLIEIANMYREIRSDRAWSDKTITDQETNSVDLIDK